jgi:hypothetical protein
MAIVLIQLAHDRVSSMPGAVLDLFVPSNTG